MKFFAPQGMLPLRRVRLADKLVACLATALVASACSRPIRPNPPSNEPWTNYAIGTAQFAATGSPIVEWIGRALILRGYRMITPVHVARVSRQPPTDPDLTWAARYTYNADGPCEGGRYVITTPKFYGDAIGIVVTEDGTIPCEESVMQLRGLRTRTWPTPTSVGVRAFTPSPFLEDVATMPIRWELIYSGRSGNEIGLAYREYASGPEGTFARQAFYQDLKYDLSTSNRIVFRDMEIEILEASNAGVTFRVLRDAERHATPSQPLRPER